MQKYQLSIDEGDYVENRDFAQLTMDEQGRFVIPQEMVKALGFEAGQRLVASKENGRLIIETREHVQKELQGMLSHLPKDRSLAEELIQERREAAKRESGE